jgi:tRNA pseudouridine32 synthase / 23S rRNA pseudouridine746 synthase
MQRASGGLPRSQAYAPPADEGLDVVHRDDHLLAINKPAGLLSVPGRGAQLQDCTLHRVQKLFPNALLVHRLDEATSGLLVFALTQPMQKALGAAFEARQISKAYVAWVHGLNLQSEGLIDAPISMDWLQRPLRKIDFLNGKPAITRYQTLQKNEQSAQTLCRLEPETGRTHQLRLHMQHMGHPIVGDRLYGNAANAKETTTQTDRLMLHASQLAFMHPASGQTVNLLSPAPF